MDEYTEAAVEIVKMQASIRPMTPKEVVNIVHSIVKTIKVIEIQKMLTELSGKEKLSSNPNQAIKEKRIFCFECGNSYKVITRKHIENHGLTPEEYRSKYRYIKGTVLACKSLVRSRRAKTKLMKTIKNKKIK